MNRTELIEILSEKLEISKPEVTRYIKAWEEEVEKALIEKGSLVLMGFGAFSLWKQSARPGRNPRENKPWMIAARNSVKFKPGKLLLKHLNDKKKSEDNNALPNNSKE